MKIRLSLLALTLGLSGATAFAQTAKTRTALYTEINANFSDNTAGAITPLILRNTVADMVASAYNPSTDGGAPGLTANNSWTGTNGFQAGSFTTLTASGAVTFSSTLSVTGGLQSTPVGSVTASSGAFTTLTATGVTSITNAGFTQTASQPILGQNDIQSGGVQFDIRNGVIGAGVWSVTQAGVANWLTITKNTGVVVVTSTVGSSSSTTGALVVDGGLGVAGALNVAGQAIPIGGFGGSLATPSTNGQFFVGISGASGAQITGQGSSQDVTIYNKTLSAVAYVPTGTTNWHIAGGLIADGASTLTGATTFGASFGYLTGAGVGATVTQLTSRTTAVAINKLTGSITLFAAAGSTTPATFTVNDNTILAGDTVEFSEASGTNQYHVECSAISSGTSFNVTFYSMIGTASDSPVINFKIVRGSTS